MESLKGKRFLFKNIPLSSTNLYRDFCLYINGQTFVCLIFLMNPYKKLLKDRLLFVYLRNSNNIKEAAFVCLSFKNEFL